MKRKIEKLCRKWTVLNATLIVFLLSNMWYPKKQDYIDWAEAKEIVIAWMEVLEMGEKNEY